MKQTKRVKTYSFVDASNIIYGARAEGWFIDQKKIIVISSPKRTAKEIREIVKDEHIDFGSLRFLLEYKKKRETLN